MEYVAVLRARRTLTWFVGILFGLIAIGLALSFKDGPPHIQMSHDAHPAIPFDWIVGAAAFAPLIVTAFLGGGLDAEYKTTAIAWTRPVSRLAIAWRYIAVDLGAMVVAWLATAAAALIVTVALGLSKYFVWGTDGFTFIVLPFGCAVMWYGLIVLVSAMFPGRGSAVAGLSWAYALIVPGLSQIPFPPLIHQVMIGLNYINPLAYLGTLNFGSRAHSSSGILAGSATDHTIVAWLIGLAALAIGTRIWASREVSA